eukprot:scaffold3198_cov175-Prasinococcus_capsulatus_cf.AAC.1
MVIRRPTPVGGCKQSTPARLSGPTQATARHHGGIGFARQPHAHGQELIYGFKELVTLGTAGAAILQFYLVNLVLRALRSYQQLRVDTAQAPRQQTVRHPTAPRRVHASLHVYCRSHASTVRGGTYLISATSLTTRPIFSPSLFSRRCRRRVVFPAPRKPDSTRIGIGISLHAEVFAGAGTSDTLPHRRGPAPHHIRNASHRAAPPPSP